MKPRVVLVSTVHQANDPRISYKIAPTLATRYEVVCVLTGQKQKDLDGIAYTSLPFFRRLILRLLFVHPVMLWKCLRLRPELVHIFVPELIPAALVLQCFGTKVIYEVQENLYKKFSIKQINNAAAFQWLFRYFDQLARRRFYCIFTEQAYLQEYANLTYAHAVVHNYASLTQIDRISIQENAGKRNQLVYAGVISMERCLDVLILALSMLKMRGLDFHLHLYGHIRVSEEQIEAIPGYREVAENVTFHGYHDQEVALSHARNCIAGIALLKPVADYPDSYTTKLFEYMALGLPVITSDFPLYKQVVEHSECGFCISPYDAPALGEKIGWLIQNPDQCARMGINGRKAVEKEYNWSKEEEVLLTFYKTLLKSCK